jgi:protein-S-isoprenylcysteine O-methyltransferase Ste14
MSAFNVFGMAVFLFLAYARLAQAAQGGGVVPVLLGVQSGAAFWLFAFRKPARRVAPLFRHALSWTCALLPLAFQARGPLWLSLPGMALALWALFALGFSFSVAPEDRGIAQRGPYRYMRHPMYLGEALACLGVVAASFSARNVLVFVSLCALWLIRIGWEERVVDDYGAYAQRVRWRLIPFVW